MEKEGIRNRLTEYLTYKQLSARKLGEICGLANGVLGRLSSTTSKSTLKKISDHSDLNIEWLMTGKGDMLVKRSDEEANIIEDIEPENKNRLIPFYDVETTGGYNDRVSASDEGELIGYIQPGGWFDGRETAAIRHVGDSMTEYPHGCILAVRKVMNRNLLVYGKNYVVETREYRITKRIQKGSSPETVALYSTNNARYEDGRLIHEPFEVDVNDIVNIYSILGYIVNDSGEMRLIKTR